MSDDLTSAIESSISGLEGSESVASDAGTETTDASVETTTDGADAGIAVSAEEQAAADAPVEEQKPVEEPVATDEPKKRKYMPMANHEKAIANAREKATKEADARHQKVVAEYEAKVSRAVAHEQALTIADQNPEAFLKALADADPRYAQLLNRQEQTQAQAQHTEKQVASEMPQPDQSYQDGTVGYSRDGLQKLLEWQAAQVKKQVEDTYRPILEPIQRERAVREQMNASVGRATKQLQHAETWPGFSDAQNKTDIHAAMKADRSLSLHDAYIKVVVPKLVANRDAMRGDLLKEIQGKPRAAASMATAPQAAASAVSGDAGDLESVIKASIAGIRH